MKTEVKSIDDFVVKYDEFRKEISKVIVGQDNVVKQVLISIFSMVIVFLLVFLDLQKLF